jgi:D-glycero-D-manno-heptose 1,7-bisphosphate phosphatase
MAVTDIRLERAVFVDKDGTLVHDVPYNADPARVGLLPHVGEGLRRLQDAGFLLIVASNQPGMAMGLFAASALSRIEARIDELLTPFGVVVADYAWCTHDSPAALRGTSAMPCACRKPKPGLLQHAAAAHGIDLEASWMVGDILDDVEAGTRAGCRTVLVDRGNETRWRGGIRRTPHVIVYDFADAVSFIVDGPHPARAPRAAVFSGEAGR